MTLALLKKLKRFASSSALLMETQKRLGLAVGATLEFCPPGANKANAN
jgi:hypothetical protein